MSKQILNCELAAREAMKAAIWERSMFCAIMGIGDGIYNSFIGGDPHGCADLQDGTYVFNMSDIHVVVSEYKRWLEYYGNNEGIAKVVRQWYYLSLDWCEKHPRMEFVEISEFTMPQAREIVLLKFPCLAMCLAYLDKDGKTWRKTDGTTIMAEPVEVMRIHDEEEPRSFPNLRSWLMGCPVKGLRKATPEFIKQEKREQEEAHERVIRKKAELDKAIKECKEGGF